MRSPVESRCKMVGDALSGVRSTSAVDMHGPSRRSDTSAVEVVSTLHPTLTLLGLLISLLLVQWASHPVLPPFLRVHSPCEGRSTQWLRLDNKELSPPHLRRRRRYGNTSAQTISRDWKKSKKTPPEETMGKCTQRNGLQLNCALWSYPQNCTTSYPQRFLPLGITVSSGNYKACVSSC